MEGPFAEGFSTDPDFFGANWFCLSPRIPVKPVPVRSGSFSQSEMARVVRGFLGTSSLFMVAHVG